MIESRLYCGASSEIVSPSHTSSSAGAPGAVLERLGAEGVRRVYVDGGAVVSQVLSAGLLDELTVSILPVVLGAGIRLFQEAGPERWLTLASSRPFAGGMVQLRYLARR